MLGPYDELISETRMLIIMNQVRHEGTEEVQWVELSVCLQVADAHEEVHSLQWVTYVHLIVVWVCCWVTFVDLDAHVEANFHCETHFTVEVVGFADSVKHERNTIVIQATTKFDNIECYFIKLLTVLATKCQIDVSLIHFT